MESKTKDLDFAEFQTTIKNFGSFRIYSLSGRYHYFNFQKSFRFDCRDYDKDALLELGTGYKDANGKEIFQNDIVKFKDKYHRIIRDDEGYFTFADDVLESDRSDIKIVGHIHSKKFEIWRDIAGSEMEWRKIK